MADMTGMYSPDDKPQTFEVIPNGEYLATIVASEKKKSTSGNGEFVEFTFELMDGEYKGRKLKTRFNLINKNPQAVAIAKGEFASLRLALGVPVVKDSIELHGLTCVIVVKVADRNDKPGEKTNEVKGYKPRSAAAASQPVASGGAAPWKR